MADVLIDTSAWIEADSRRRDPRFRDTVRQLLKNDRVVTTDPVIFEILAGVKPHKQKFWETRLQGVKHINVQGRNWYTAASYASRLRRKGVTVKNFDILIATIAIDNNLALLHHGRDFDHISNHLPLKVLSTS